MALASLGPLGAEGGKQSLRAVPYLESLLGHRFCISGSNWLQFPCSLCRRLDAADVGFDAVGQLDVFAVVKSNHYGTGEAGGSS